MVEGLVFQCHGSDSIPRGLKKASLPTIVSLFTAGLQNYFSNGFSLVMLINGYPVFYCLMNTCKYLDSWAHSGWFLVWDLLKAWICQIFYNSKYPYLKKKNTAGNKFSVGISVSSKSWWDVISRRLFVFFFWIEKEVSILIMHLIFSWRKVMYSELNRRL